jgi:DNA polymerase-1
VALDAPLPESDFARGKGDADELQSLSDWVGFGPLTRKRLTDAAGLRTVAG